VSDEFKRPSEVQELRGDATKAKTVLGWKPQIRFFDLVAEMIDAEGGAA